MRNKSTLSAMLAVFGLFISINGHASVTTTFHPIYFQTDSFSLSDESRQQLNEFVTQLPTTGEIEIFISGHTDAEGNKEYNRQLSEVRAESVARELVLLGVPIENIRDSYYGESKPVAANNTETGKAKNRRVEIALRHTVINSITDIVDIDPSLLPQQFQVNTAAQQTIKGKKGIEITIPDDAFVDASGKEIKPGSATVTLTEFTGIADAFFHGLTTMSDKGTLESGGMFNLTATAGGKPLQLKPGKELAVKIPAVNPAPDMKVYLSKTDADGKIVWTETGASFKATTQPADTQRIQLKRDKYSAFLKTRVQMPDVNDIPKLNTTMPAWPDEVERPRLVLQKEQDLKTSGLPHITRNKKLQRQMLERINQNIRANNEKRQLKYEQQLSAYLADSAAWPQKMKAYEKAMAEYDSDYSSRKQELDNLMETYREAVVKQRLHYYLAKVIEASEKGELYNSNLVERVRGFCTTETTLLRDLAWEKELIATTVAIAQKRRVIRCGWDRDYYRFREFAPLDAFNRVIRDPEVMEVMAALIDDNPYLSAKEKQWQKEGLSKGLVVSSISQLPPTSFYSATVGQLGYVNCDRLHSNDKVVAMQVENLNSAAQSVAFIKGINASQHISQGANNFGKDEDVRLLSVYFENGRPQVAYREVKANNSQKVTLEYKPMRTEEFKDLVLSFI